MPRQSDVSEGRDRYHFSAGPRAILHRRVVSPPLLQSEAGAVILSAAGAKDLAPAISQISRGRYPRISRRGGTTSQVRPSGPAWGAALAGRGRTPGRGSRA